MTFRFVKVTESTRNVGGNHIPKRQLVAKELAEVLGVIADPDRIRIIEELRADEGDVNSLVDTLELPGPRISQRLCRRSLLALTVDSISQET